MARIASQEYATYAIPFSHQLMHCPWLDRFNLHVEIEAGGPLDSSLGVFRERLGLVHGSRHEKPEVTFIHRPTYAGHICVHQPIHDGLSNGDFFRQAWRTEHDRVVPIVCVLTLHGYVQYIITYC